MKPVFAREERTVRVIGSPHPDDFDSVSICQMICGLPFHLPRFNEACLLQELYSTQ